MICITLKTKMYKINIQEPKVIEHKTFREQVEGLLIITGDIYRGAVKWIFNLGGYVVNGSHVTVMAILDSKALIRKLC